MTSKNILAINLSIHLLSDNAMPPKTNILYVIAFFIKSQPDFYIYLYIHAEKGGIFS